MNLGGLVDSRRPRVVVVEDNPVTPKMLRATLEADGFEVFEAADGRTALELVTASQPALVL